MPIDKEQIKKALDHFENDEFVDAKKILQKQVATAKDDYLKDKLNLKGDKDEEESSFEQDVEQDDDEIGDEEK